MERIDRIEQNLDQLSALTLAIAGKQGRLDDAMVTLTEALTKMAEAQAHMADAHAHTAEVQARLAEAQAHMAEAQAHTDSRLDVLIGIMDAWIRREK